MSQPRMPTWLYFVLGQRLYVGVHDGSDDVDYFMVGSDRFVASLTHPVTAFLDRLADVDGRLVGVEFIAVSPVALELFATVHPRPYLHVERGLIRLFVDCERQVNFRNLADQAFGCHLFSDAQGHIALSVETDGFLTESDWESLQSADVQWFSV